MRQILTPTAHQIQISDVPIFNMINPFYQLQKWKNNAAINV